MWSNAFINDYTKINQLKVKSRINDVNDWNFTYLFHFKEIHIYNIHSSFSHAFENCISRFAFENRISRFAFENCIFYFAFVMSLYWDFEISVNDESNVAEKEQSKHEESRNETEEKK